MPRLLPVIPSKRFQIYDAYQRIRKVLQEFPEPHGFEPSRSAALRVAEGLILVPTEDAAKAILQSDQAGTLSLVTLARLLHCEDLKGDGTPSGAETPQPLPYVEFASWLIEAEKAGRAHWKNDSDPFHG